MQVLMQQRPFLSLLFLFSTISGDVSGSRELYVRPKVQNFRTGLGSSFVFTCGFEDQSDSSTSSSVLKWYRGDKEITDKLTRVYVEEETESVLKLYFIEIREEDKGVYRCSDGTQDKSIELDLFKDITFDHAPEVQHPAIHTNAVIECEVSGNPKPDLSWRYKSDRIQLNDRYKVVAKGLLIQNITLEDDGIYICRAEVEAEGRYNEKKITVAVHIPPSITEGPGNSEGVEGEELTISCKAEGLPDPEFQYLKDGSKTPLVSSDRIKVDSKTGNVIFNPIMKDDEGKYTCFAHNDVGNSTHHGEVIVRVKPSIHDFPNASQTEGQSLSIVCASRGDPAPKIMIQKVGNNASYSTGADGKARIVVASEPESGQATLTFDGLTIDDAGDYVCKAENKLGSDEKFSKITVTYRPRFSHNQPKLVYIWAGKVRNITCDVKAVPLPSITWLRNGIKLVDNDTFTTFTLDLKSSLQVRVMESDQTWIYGDYICEATNEWGTNEFKIELLRASSPDSPQSVNVSDSSPTDVVLTVLPPLNNGGEKVIAYRVEYFEKPSDANISIGGGGVDQGGEYIQISKSYEVQDTNVIEIDGLKPNTTYTFWVRAKNEVGVGNPKELVVTTEAVRKPNPITIISEEKAPAFTYTIKWKKPITGGLPITEYEIKYRKLQVKNVENGAKEIEDWNRVVRKDNSEKPMTSFELERLHSKTNYEVHIRAKNDLGWSDMTEFQFQTGEASPEEVASMQASVGTGAIAGIVVVIFVVLLVVVDISCYFVNNCGVTMCICVHLCGKSATLTKEKAMEEGESKEVLKQPIETYQAEDCALDGAGQTPALAYDESKEQCLKTEEEKETKKEKEALTEALKEGIEPQKEKMELAEEVKIPSDADEEKSDKAPIV